MASVSDNKVIFEKEGVFIHTTIVQADEDALVAGKIVLIQRAEGLFMEWHEIENEIQVPVKGGSENEGSGWAVIEPMEQSGASVSYKNNKSAHPVEMNIKQTKIKEKHKYVVNFELSDLKSFKRSRPNLGWSYIIFILKCGTTCPALHFHQGGTKALMKELDKYLHVRKSPNDPCLYLVREHDPAALSQSFDELHLFEQQSNDVISKFIRDPYTATLGGFSKVTKFLNDAFVIPEGIEHQSKHDDVASVLSVDIAGLNIENMEESGFEVVTRTVELPPRPQCKRFGPLLPSQWAGHLDDTGKVKNVTKLEEEIFRGGVDASIRIEVWKFLLGYYRWDSTYKSRTEQRKKKVDDYFRMKLQWRSVSEDQESRFNSFKEKKILIEKDVHRTDRTHPFFEGDDNPNISVLYDVLMTYCMYNFDLGYVQGMSDLLSPILVTMENEVDAFWCLVGYMNRVEDNFEMAQEGMKQQLHQLNVLCRFVDPQLCNYLESHDSSNMYFCFRWLLIHFKREFSFNEVMRIWEVIWTDLPCKNFHLLISLAILDTEKNLLIENNFGFTEILKHINDISGSIDLEHTLRVAEAMYVQISTYTPLPDYIRDILDIPTPVQIQEMDTNTNNSAYTTPLTTPTTPEHIHDILEHSNSSNIPSPDSSGSIEILAEQPDMFL